MAEVQRIVLWREIADPGTHWCELARERNGWRLTGIVLTIFDGHPARVRYDVVVDEAWATRDVEVVIRSGATGAQRRLHLTVDADQRWQVQRDPPPAAGTTPDVPEAWRGLFDIDLSLSPATNTLPIRRIAPAIGEAIEPTAVWLIFPELTIARLPQRYTRLDDRRYRYESHGGAFQADIVVDDLGLVVSYAGLWQRIAEGGDG
jgi:hypothetical protein